MEDKDIRVIFGLKIRTFRKERAHSLTELAKLAGLSVSYLNEIEKGKKYPKAEKIMSLASALGVSYDDLVSLRLESEMDSVDTILRSPLVRKFPYQAFGISAKDVLRLLTASPLQSSGLVRMIGEIARNYDMRVENFFYTALRAYQALHLNHFEELEQAAADFRQRQGLGDGRRLDEAWLIQFLASEFGVRVDDTTLRQYEELRNVRCISGGNGSLILNPWMTKEQKLFVLARELGFRVLNLTERASVFPAVEVGTYDQVHNNFRASYFAGALLMPRAQVVQHLGAFFKRKRWDGQAFLALIRSFGVTAETFFYRMTEVLPDQMGLKQIHFLRFEQPQGTDEFSLTKQLNMSNVPIPYGIGLKEHFCRRWLSVSVFEAEAVMAEGRPLVFAQRSSLIGSQLPGFFCIAIVYPSTLDPGRLISLTVGFQMSEHLRNTIAFIEDPALEERDLGQTCERCPLAEGVCPERAVAPVIFQNDQVASERNKILARLIEGEG